LPETEEKIDLGKATLTAGMLETALDKLFQKNKPNIMAWMAEMRAEHEDNFVWVDSHVAVIDVGVNQIGNWDGANGYHQINAIDYVDWMRSINPDYEPDESVYITKQGLEKMYRFKLIINDQGEPDIITNPYLVPIDKAKYTTLSSVEMLQRRIDL
jgi:hypothetical protein